MALGIAQEEGGAKTIRLIEFPAASTRGVMNRTSSFSGILAMPG
jgi:hypothetical protein